MNTVIDLVLAFWPGEVALLVAFVAGQVDRRRA